MNELLPTMEGESRDPAKSQWFTPPDLARRVVEWAGIEKGMSVLEPSAGRGALLYEISRSLRPYGRMSSFEIDPIHRAHLEQQFSPRCRVGGDFFAWTADEFFDLAIMNPPYEGGRDVLFAAKCLCVCDRVVGIFAARIVHSKGRSEFWRHTDIQRMAILSERPRFGGDYTPMTDFVILELVRRQHARRQGEATPTLTEWW